MMKKRLKQIYITVSVFCSVVIMGFLLLCLVYSIPTERVAMHVRETGNEMVQEGNYWEMVTGKHTTRLDNFTDSIMLLTAAYDGSESIVDKAVNNYKTYGKGMTKQESLQICGQEGETELVVVPYARYWHGYIAALKPLLLFLNLNEIRDINLFMIISYISLISVLLYRWKKGKYILPFLLAYCFMNPVTIANSLQYSTIFHLTSIAIIILLSCYRNEGFKNYIWIYFMIVGMFTSYVDLLTYPVVAMALPIMFYFILTNEIKIMHNLKRMISYSVFWCVGYGGMWGAKWLVSTILMQKNYFADAIETFTVRTGNVVGEKDVVLVDVYNEVTSFFNENSLRYFVYLIIVLCILCVIIGGVKKRNYSLSLVFLLMSIYPFIWYAVLKNHSFIHAWFAYRNLSVTVMGITCLGASLINFEKYKKNPSEQSCF